jgi:hypothetical protein
MLPVAKGETRYQRIHHLIREGQCGLLPLDFTCPCPKRGGPDHPHSDHPVGLPIVLPLWQGYASIRASPATSFAAIGSGASGTPQSLEHFPAIPLKIGQICMNQVREVAHVPGSGHGKAMFPTPVLGRTILPVSYLPT